MTTQPPIKRRKLDFTEEYKIVVGTGTEQATWTIAKHFLVKHSEFFKSACSKDWKEGQTKVIELKTLEPDTFAIYMQWLYTGELVVDELDDEARKQTNLGQSFLSMIDVYVLADFLRDLPVRNAVTDLIREYDAKYALVPASTQFARVIDETPEGSTLARLLTDIYAARVALDEKMLKYCPPSVMKRLLQKFFESREAKVILVEP